VKQQSYIFHVSSKAKTIETNVNTGKYTLISCSGAYRPLLPCTYRVNKNTHITQSNITDSETFISKTTYS